jgi:hypothetical protein
MSCADFKERLLDLALDAERGDAALAEHLETCAACCAELEAQRRVVAAMDRALAEDVSDEPSPAFVAQVRRRIEESSASRAWWPAWVPAAVGIALVALFIAWTLLRTPAGVEREPEIARNSPPVKVEPPLKLESQQAIEKTVWPPRPKGAGSQVAIAASAREPEILIPPGQMAAVWQLYDAVWSGRAKFSGGPANAEEALKPLQLAKLELPPLEIVPIVAGEEAKETSPGR